MQLWIVLRAIIPNLSRVLFRAIFIFKLELVYIWRQKMTKSWNKLPDLMIDQYLSNWLSICGSLVTKKLRSWSSIFRFNAFYAMELTKYQPISENAKVTLNSLRYRGLDGFVAAVSPFNFTAIGGNLAYTPALMVNIIQHSFFALV